MFDSTTTRSATRRPRTLTVAGAAVAASALVLVLGACGGGSDSGSGSGKTDQLVVQSTWTKGSKEGDALQKAIASFEKSSGVKVKLVDTGESTADVFENDVLAGKEADIVLTNLAEKSNDWVTNGAAIDMTTYLKDWGLADKIRPDAVAEWTKDGKLLGLPYSGFAWPVWYNTALLKQAGISEPPTTIEELEAAATALRAKGLQPMAIGGSDWSGQKLFLQVAQTFAKPDEAKKVFAEGGYCKSADIMKGIDLFVELRDKLVFVDSAEGYNADSMNSMYFTSKAAMMPAGSWAFTNIPAELAPDTYLGGLAIPSGAAYDKPTAYQGYTGVGIFMSKNGEKKVDTVHKFVDAMYDGATVSDFVSTASLIPASTTAKDAEVTNPLLSQTVSDLDGRVDYAVMPDTVVPGAAADSLISATAKAFTPGNDSQAICSAVDAVYTGQ